MGTSSTTDFEGQSQRGSSIKQTRRRVGPPVSALSFWSAVLFPVVYVPLFLSGIDTVDGLALFLGLFVLHVLSLIGGRHYEGRSA